MFYKTDYEQLRLEYACSWESQTPWLHVTAHLKIKQLYTQNTQSDKLVIKDAVILPTE